MSVSLLLIYFLRGAWEWVAGSKSSIIAEWNLVCHKRFQAEIPASFFFLCILFGKKTEPKGNFAELCVEAIGCMASSMAFDILYVYCIELFPTNARNFAISMLRMALMLGVAISSHLVVLGWLSPAFSFVILGGLSVFSGLIATWSPETRNAPLCETLEPQEKMMNTPIAEMEAVAA